MNDKLIIAVDRNEKSNEFGICVMREENEKIRILKIEVNDEARVLYRALTDQSFKIQQRKESDLMTRKEAINVFKGFKFLPREQKAVDMAIEALKQEPRPIGLCKDCKYFEYDSVAKVDGVPLIVAHEICNKWGNGCKSREDGYCFLFEEKERSDKE